MKRSKKFIGKLFEEDFEAFRYFLINGSFTKEEVLKNISIEEERFDRYITSKLIKDENGEFTLSKDGYKKFYQNAIRHYSKELKCSTDISRKEVNLYILGDVLNAPGKIGYSVCCLEYKEHKKEFFLEEDNCKSSQVIMLKSIYKALNMLKFSCIVNIYTPSKLGLASCIKIDDIKEVRGTAFNFELKTLCQLTALKGKHEVNMFESIDTYKEQYELLQSEIEEKISVDYKIAV